VGREKPAHKYLSDSSFRVNNTALNNGKSEEFSGVFFISKSADFEGNSRLLVGRILCQI
jgi:hypothetical protein